jgi:uncharacterized membrane protein HdeD (DUF308 family)
MEISVERRLRHWWVFLLRGILFIFVGIYMIASPATSFIALGFMFGLIILFAGVAELLHAVRDRGAGNRGWHLFLGIVDIILGIILIGHIAASMTILRTIVGIWFIIRGISLFSFSGLVGRSWLLVLGGIITALFGLLVLFDPTFGDLTIIIWTAIALIITGIFNVLLGIGLRSH